MRMWMIAELIYSKMLCASEGRMAYSFLREFSKKYEVNSEWIPKSMNNLTLAVSASVLNYLHAAFIYFSMYDWFQWHEPSGMQLIAHLVFTGPITIVTTAWLYLACRANNYRQSIWLLNFLGLLIPFFSSQSGSVLQFLIIFGIFVSLALPTALVLMLRKEFKRALF